MKIAVTAASGKLGEAIIQELLALHPKEEVIGLARTPEKAAHLGVEVRPGDYNDFGELEQSLRGIDVLLLVSGMDAPDKRIPQHLNVIQASNAAVVTAQEPS